MFFSIDTIQGAASIVYTIVGITCLLVSYHFFLSKNGLLRKILICIFLSWSIHYLIVAMLFAGRSGIGMVTLCGIVLTILDFIGIMSLYYYIKWRK